MSPSDVRAMLRREPFVPFRLHISELTHYDITNPEMVMVGAWVTIIGIVRNVNSEFFDEPVIISNRHITRLEPIITADAPQ